MKILAVRNDRLGEFLLTIPALRALKECYTRAALALVLSPYVQELTEDIGIADSIIPWENKKHRPSELIALVRKLRQEKFDLCIIFNPSREFNIIGFLAGIPVRIWYARKWPFLLTHKIEDKKYLGLSHEVEYNLELAGLAGINTENKRLSLKIDNGIIINLYKENNITERDTLVAIHPWTSDPIKQWPRDYFLELALRLKELAGLKVIIIGGKEEADKSGNLYSDQSGLINLACATTLKQLAALLSRCKLLISGDSGPVHLASGVGGRVLALFRNDIQGKTAKRWGPWGEGHYVIEKNNLSDITVDEVFNKAKEM